MVCLGGVVGTDRTVLSSPARPGLIGLGVTGGAQGRRGIMTAEPNSAAMTAAAASNRPAWVSAAFAGLAVVVSEFTFLLNAYALRGNVEFASNSWAYSNLLAIDQLCMNWASYVKRLDRQGLRAQQIDSRGRWFSNVSATSPGFRFAITDVCGSTRGILHLQGMPPATQARP